MPEERPISTAIKAERAYLVGIDWKNSKFPADESLRELERLAHTAGAEVIASTSQRIISPNPRTFIGSGKAAEVAEQIKELNADVLIIDDELSPSQQSNLEKLVPKNVKVIDRTALILDIFGLHAKSKEGKLQVQLAQLEYLLPRLRGMWSHLAKEQTRGGIGSRFGQGESQLEVDRRLIRDKIAGLKRELKQVSKIRETQRKSRWEAPIFRVALAGYTNAGKSSLLNKLTQSQVYAKDQLFATLDPTTRSLKLPEGREVSLTDTVGFIQKLPHSLVESFNSTLSEVIGADLILQVIDSSSPFRDEQVQAVHDVLDSIGASHVESLAVYNKCDLLDPLELFALRQRYPEAVFISALNGEGLDDLLIKIAKRAAAHNESITVLLPFTADGSLVKIAHEKCQVLHEHYNEKGLELSLKVPKELISLFKPFELIEQA